MLVLSALGAVWGHVVSKISDLRETMRMSVGEVHQRVDWLRAETIGRRDLEPRLARIEKRLNGFEGNGEMRRR